MLRESNGAMVVAMRTMCKMQVTVDEIIHMVSVRHGFMAAAGPVAMGGFMPATGVGRRAVGGVFRPDGQHVLVHMVFVQVVQMTIVQVILMVIMVDGAVAAIGSVPVRMGVMHVMSRHASLRGERSKT